MLHKILAKFFCKKFYPTKNLNWYKNKGYKGNNAEEVFADFLLKQSDTGSQFFDCFQNLSIKRFSISSEEYLLDTVRLMPAIQDAKLPGYGCVIIMFQGRGEYYESKFRDMALLAKLTGATVIGFNPKGFHSSTGRTHVLQDIVNDGIAIAQFLMAEGYLPSQIIMLGNSLGGAVQEMVCQHFRSFGVIGFRQINSNSFRCLAAVLAYRWQMPFLEPLIAIILNYAGWEIKVDNSFYTTGKHRCYMRRYQDRTILAGAEYHDGVNVIKDISNSPVEQRDIHAWLCAHSQLELINSSTKDPHNESLNKFKVKKLTSDNMEYSVFDFINIFLAF